MRKLEALGYYALSLFGYLFTFHQFKAWRTSRKLRKKQEKLQDIRWVRSVEVIEEMRRRVWREMHGPHVPFPG